MFGFLSKKDFEIWKLRQELDAALPSKQLFDRLSKNPVFRRRLLEMMKEDNPSLNIPELDK